MNNMRNKILSLLVLLLTAASGAWATEVEQSESFTTNTSDNVYTGNNFKITVDSFGDSGGFYLSEIYYATIEALNGETITKVEFTRGYDDINAFSCEVGTTNISGDVATVSGVNQTSLSFSATGPLQIKAVKVYFITAPDVEVTTNAASEGATFTEAWFNMPAFDATAEYELVRDMSIQMTATMGDGTDGVRYRVKKAQQGEGYEPADLNMMQVLALVAVNDGIEQKALTQEQDYYCRIYKLDEQTLQPEGDGVMLYDFDFAPGLYALKAFGQDDSDYAGETAFSNTFKLFQGYEVTVPAGEFATFYKDENLYADTETSADAQIYTIQSVTGDEAVLSSQLNIVAANTPMLVYNAGEVTTTFLLIPTEDDADEVTAAPEFQGTLTARDFTADDMAAADYYTLSGGKIFVPVYEAGTIAANKCWLQFNHQQTPGARTITLIFGDDATGIDSMVNGRWSMDTWYDLNGRKLNGMPTKKGIYILNGKKVVVK